MKKYLYIMALVAPCLLQAMQSKYPKYPGYPKSLSEAREQLPGPIKIGSGPVSGSGPIKIGSGPVFVSGPVHTHPGVSSQSAPQLHGPVNQASTPAPVYMNDMME